MADDMNPVDTATQYFIALYAGETDTVRELAATDMAFQDPTAPDAYGVPILNELEPVLDLFSGFSGDSVNVDITNAYASNDQVVLTFELSGTLPGASLGMEVETISFESNGVTVLQVTDGQVVSHTDYVNYPRFEGSITPVQ
ncbi:MAG: ester cyclase [Pseudomonadota bacterium]